ncbi:MAG: sugar porter family MFS transporter [Cyclobacteriaceae bacterium]|nr:sugar porter family MFS transporter [Cyclobacteriaceae bacterium]
MKKVFFWSITVAMGGFLFGFDTAVISGAEQSIQQLWQLTDIYHGLAVAIALYGTVIGALVGGIPADLFGRKKTLFWIGVLYLISAIGSAMAPEIYSFMLLRFIGGLGVGASSVVAPMYISEVSPASQRGKLVALFQFNIVLGILIAYFSNYLMAGVGENAWRLMLGVEAIPATAFVILVTMVPESPRWLIIKRNNIEAARKVFMAINPDGAEAALESVRKSDQDDVDKKTSTRIFSSKYRFPVMLAFLFAFFNQVSGINAIIYYAPRIFDMTGLAKGSALLSTIGIGVLNLIFTMVGMAIIDRFGRKTLMYIGSVGLVFALAMVSRSFYMEQFTGVPVFLFAYIAFFAMSQGAVIWVFIAEIFPNRVRAAGQSLGSFTHWILAALIANAFPFFVNKYDGGPIFLFFSVMMVVQLFFVWKIMPETRNATLEDLEKKLVRD